MPQDKRFQGRGVRPHPDDDRVLDRIYWRRSEWDQLNWYVSFAMKDLGTLSTGELTVLQEEVYAIQRTLVRTLYPESLMIVNSRGKFELEGSTPDLSKTQIKMLHDFFREKMTAFVKSGFAEFGPFELTIYLGFLGTASEVIGGKDVYGWSPLPYHCARLCAKFPLAIGFCSREGCGNIFLRPRKNAHYCSRTCQNRQAMKDLYQRKKAARASLARRSGSPRKGNKQQGGGRGN